MGDRYECMKGWRLAGWASAPWTSEQGRHAIVYEKTVAADQTSCDSHDSFEPGLYWGHGDAHKMQFGGRLAESEADELAPWLT